MTYKQKVFLLMTIIAFMSLLYGGTILLDPQRTDQRNSLYTWLRRDFISQTNRLEISGSLGTSVLSRINNRWVLIDEGMEYPVLQVRVTDLLLALSRQADYPVQAASASAAINLGLDENASRIIVRGGPGLPLLDLMVGYSDPAGRNIYLRKTGQAEIRSGQDIFSIYTESGKTFWYDLRLLADLELPLVQKVIIAPMRVNSGRAGDIAFVLSRSRENWIIEHTGEIFPRGESFLHSLLDARGERFDFSQKPQVIGSITLELGDARSILVYFGPPDPEGVRCAWVSGSSLVFYLSSWTASHIWPDNSFFTDF